MVSYLVLAKIIDQELFQEYLKGHLPTIAAYGGSVVFRSIANQTLLGTDNWDAIAIQQWPDSTSFERWWHSEEYRPWAGIRDKAARITIISMAGAEELHAFTDA